MIINLERILKLKLKDIAELADVSTATVSRVINNKAGVKDEVRKKVKKVIKENNYTPNLMARGLASQKSNAIGLVIPKYADFYADLVNSIIKYCSQQEYRVIITTSTGQLEENKDNLNMLYQSQVEGIIYCVARMTDEKKKILQKINQELPIVSLNQDIADLDIPAVLSDNYTGTVKAVEYLINKGHQRIAFIKPHHHDPEGQKRFSAYQNAMHNQQLKIPESYLQESDYSIESGYQAMQDIVEQAEILPTAVLGANDHTAIGAINYLQEHDFLVPEDISVMGIDDIKIAKYYNPKLTTIRQELSAMGQEAVKLLFEYIANPDLKAKKLVMDQKLIIRDSVKKINEKK